MSLFSRDPFVPSQPADLTRSQSTADPHVAGQPGVHAPNTGNAPPEPTRNRASSNWPIVAFIAIFAMSIVGALRPEIPRLSPAAAHALSDMNSNVQAINQQAADQLRRGEVVTFTTAEREGKIAEMKRSLDTAAANADPETAKIMRASSRLMVTLNGLASAAQKLDEELCDLGGIQPGSFESRGALQKRIELAKKVTDAQAECVIWLDSAEAHVRSELVSEGLGLAAVPQVVRDYARGAKFDTLREINRHSLAVSEHTHAVLLFLDEHWGQWKPSEEWYAFSTKEQAHAFDRRVALLTDANNAMTMAQAKHFDVKDEIAPLLLPAAGVLSSTPGASNAAAPGAPGAGRPRW